MEKCVTSNGVAPHSAGMNGSVPGPLASMAEDEPNQNDPGFDTAAAIQGPRWGPQHAGAVELASQYTFGTLDGLG